MTNPTRMTTGAIVDEIGTLRAQIAELSAREKSLRATLDRRMPDGGAAEGDFFRVAIAEFTVERLDTKGLRADLGDDINGYLVPTTQRRMTVTARLKEAA
jgi:hypothetical protein